MKQTIIAAALAATLPLSALADHPLAGSWWGTGFSQHGWDKNGGAALFRCDVDPDGFFFCSTMARRVPEHDGIRRAGDFGGEMVLLGEGDGTRLWRVEYYGDQDGDLTVALQPKGSPHQLTIDMVSVTSTEIPEGFIEHTVMSRGAPPFGSQGMRDLMQNLDPHRAD